MARAKGKKGKPPHRPTAAKRKLVRNMTLIGVPQTTQAKILDIAAKTLRARYRTELDHALNTVNAKIAGTLVDQALVRKDTVALIFLAKTRLGWRETAPVEDPDKKLIRIRATRIEKSEHGADGTIN